MGHLEWYYCLRKIILRNHPEVVQNYEKLKRNLATKYGADRENYTNAKTEFITSVVRQAKAK